MLPRSPYTHIYIHTHTHIYIYIYIYTYTYHLPNYDTLRLTEHSLSVSVLSFGVQSCIGATSTEYCCSLESTVKEKWRYVEIIYESPPVVPSEAGYILLKMVRGCEYETAALHTPAARPSFHLILLNCSLTFSITSQNKHLQLEAQKLAARSQEEIDLS